jgi:hypothetical protein
MPWLRQNIKRDLPSPSTLKSEKVDISWFILYYFINFCDLMKLKKERLDYEGEGKRNNDS